MAQLLAVLIVGFGWSGIGLVLLTDWRGFATRASQGPVSRHHARLRGRTAWRLSGGFLLVLGLGSLSLMIGGRPG